MALYSISDKVISESKSQVYMDPGVHENVELTDVKLETTEAGNTYLAYYWKNKLGQQVSKTEYEVRTTGNKPVAQLTAEEKETYDNMCLNQARRILYVAKQFVPKAELEGRDFDTFKSFVEFIKSKLTTDKYQGVQLRLKVVYDKNGWCTVPSYVRETSNPWIERMDLVETSKMAVDSSIDRTTRENTSNRKTTKAVSDLIDDGTVIGSKPERNIGTFDTPSVKVNDDLPF